MTTKRDKGRAGHNAAESVTGPSNKVSADPATPAKTLAAADQQPDWNIKYTGRPRWDKGKKKRLDHNAPIESFVDVGRVIELPSPSAQERKRTFYHPDANLIVRYFPHLYKIRRTK